MHISIVGGGITGLSTAIALHKLGLKAHVFEQAPALRPVGAGIWLQPNALKVLDWLGIGAEIRGAGSRLGMAEISDSQLIPFRKTADSWIQDTGGRGIISLHRGELQRILVEALPEAYVHLGIPYLSHKQTDSGNIRIQAGEETWETDVVLGADGIHSGVRETLFPGTSLRYSGQTCWRGISEMELPLDFQHRGIEAWGEGVRFGLSQVSAGKCYWFAVAKAPEGSRTIENVKVRLTALYSSFHPLVPQLINHTPKILQNDLHDLERLPAWHKGNVCLLGDAAHATTPNMGQGAGQGIEDAYYISQAMAKHDTPQQAFKAFEAYRRDKVDYVVNTSWRIGQAAHHPIGRRIVPLMMKLSPDSMIQKQMDRLFELSPL